ncbi:MAG: hypothetical protein KKF26_00155 [Chloroflexi bacterium]|nr:hypothetical protein [Chloroflexota bacterium]
MEKLKRFYLTVLNAAGWCYFKCVDREQAKGFETPWKYRPTVEDWTRERKGLLSCLFIMLFTADIIAMGLLTMWFSDPWYIIPLILFVVGVFYVFTHKRFRHL